MASKKYMKKAEIALLHAMNQLDRMKVYFVGEERIALRQEQLKNIEQLKLAMGEDRIDDAMIKEIRRQIRKIGDKMDHRTLLGSFMEDLIVPQWANNIQAFVYGGAALLIVIVGLRGFKPDWVNFEMVIAGISIEAVLLIVLAVVFFFTPEEADAGHKGGNGSGQLADLVHEVKGTKTQITELVAKTETEVAALNEAVTRLVLEFGDKLGKYQASSGQEITRLIQAVEKSQTEANDRFKQVAEVMSKLYKGMETLEEAKIDSKVTARVNSIVTGITRVLSEK
jgi:hypothetical protein